MEIHHETVTLEKPLPASPEEVFQAYTDPRAREKWSAPDNTTEIRILESNVKTGGSETGKCGTRGQELNWRMDVAYHLVENDRLITFTEELWDGDNMLTVALITFDLSKAPDGTTILLLTDQITSFVGEGGVQGHRDGYTKALDNLASMLGEKVE
ncbi:uncharacterized protein YndB with AHSA1/START domain [Litoreibacter ponti]|uniref:Uncharacterized protein YndB with AHSA1/START domain n=1 Tax=Litoreibacter ponti TaxID=1510457 RepID=A0A2T6BJT1_9RHOB|nr:SRPBCC domain-containing protein [Litoreibacter ponti]PTX56314.1 uncharacterized protein YndB with AHSA1/START domain [Litoreibacter ponti]